MNLNGANLVKDTFRHNVRLKYTQGCILPDSYVCRAYRNRIMLWNYAMRKWVGEITLVKGRGVKFRFSIAGDVAYWNYERSRCTLFIKPVNLMQICCLQKFRIFAFNEKHWKSNQKFFYLLIIVLAEGSDETVTYYKIIEPSWNPVKS